MEKIKILVDSCADLSGNLLEKYDIDYARMNTVYNGKEMEASLTWDEYTPSQLYDLMRNGERVTTTQVPGEEFVRIFTKYLSEGYDIVYIACSSKQSGSVFKGTIEAKELLRSYPDRKIECIDSLNASIGEGMLGIYASELVREGKSFEEIVKSVYEHRNLVNEYCTVHTLDYLKRAGRVKASKAFFGNLMGVKPILIADANGEQTPIKKVKGRQVALKEIVDLLAESMTDKANATVYIAHADCKKEEIDLLTNFIQLMIPCKNVETVYIGPIIGASVGPDAIGVWAFGNEVTFEAQV